MQLSHLLAPGLFLLVCELPPRLSFCHCLLTLPSAALPQLSFGTILGNETRTSPHVCMAETDTELSTQLFNYPLDAPHALPFVGVRTRYPNKGFQQLTDPTRQITLTPPSLGQLATGTL